MSSTEIWAYMELLYRTHLLAMSLKTMKISVTSAHSSLDLTFYCHGVENKRFRALWSLLPRDGPSYGLGKIPFKLPLRNISLIGLY